MKLRSALLAATVLVAPVAAKAQAISGIYIGAGVGGNFMQSESVTGLSFPQRAAGTTGTGFNGSRISLNGGIIGLASVGYGLGNGLRLEVEGGYRKNQFNRANSGPGVASAGGDEVKYSGMFNVLYDIDLASMGVAVPVVPYVGVGVGYSWAQDKNARFYGNGGPAVGNTQLRTNDGRGDFAYQAIIGAALPIAAVPGLALTLEYRFQGLAGDRTYNYQYAQGGPAPGFFTRARVKMDSDYNHSALIGVRYAFNAAPPPVVAAPAPMAPMGVARTYLVFFDWDRADLTDRARQIIAEAAQATTKTQVTRIMVSGHTDTTGTARYNQGLSVRRAQNVAAELVRLGVPRAAITTQGFGFSKPLVATGPNVREPQNRRVEIVLQ
jgi:outer membrane protein OmpA-like peptidoglycan-associated protein